MTNCRKFIKKVAIADITSSQPFQKCMMGIRNITALVLTLGFLWLTTGMMAADRTDEDTSPESRVKMFFIVIAKNATTTLYLNGEEIPWMKKEYSMQTSSGVSVIRYTVSTYANQAENVVGISASAAGSDPGVRIQVSREETDVSWKSGRPENNDWLKLSFDDKAWPVTIPKSQEYNWTLSDDVNNAASYTWGADQTAQKVCFRQMIRGVEKSDQNVKYTIYDWGKVLEGLGYHRAIVRVPDDMEKSRIVNISVHTRLSGNTSVVWAHVPWRRRDVNPGQKAIFIHDSENRETDREFRDHQPEPGISRCGFRTSDCPG